MTNAYYARRARRPPRPIAGTSAATWLDAVVQLGGWAGLFVIATDRRIVAWRYSEWHSRPKGTPIHLSAAALRDGRVPPLGESNGYTSAWPIEFADGSVAHLRARPFEQFLQQLAVAHAAVAGTSG